MQGLRTAIYRVADLTAAKAWYTEAFGKAPYFDEPFYVGFNIGGYELGLQPEETQVKDKPVSCLTYWGVGPDVQQEYDRLLSLGATELEPPMGVGGPLIVAAVRDPWENPLGIIYNPAFTPE